MELKVNVRRLFSGLVDVVPALPRAVSVHASGAETSATARTPAAT